MAAFKTHGVSALGKRGHAGAGARGEPGVGNCAGQIHGARRVDPASAIHAAGERPRAGDFGTALVQRHVHGAGHEVVPVQQCVDHKRVGGAERVDVAAEIIEHQRKWRLAAHRLRGGARAHAAIRNSQTVVGEEALQSVTVTK